MTVQLGSYQALVPIAVASCWALLVLCAEMFSADRRHEGIGWLSVLGLVIVAYSTMQAGGPAEFGDALVLDGLSSFVCLLLCGLAAVVIFMAMDYLPTADVAGGEHYPLLLFAVVGLMVMVSATDLIVVFLGLEVMSMAVYVLAGVCKKDLRSNEAALKYFLLGAFASGFMLYGIALLYAEAGSTKFDDIAIAAAVAPAGATGVLLRLGAVMLLVGFGFKIAAVPFHLWTPDVYEGAPTSITAFMATVVKVGAFAAIVRTLMFALEPLAGELGGILWAGAALTMTVGHVVALRQTSLKRMLAYSSIAHSGYLLVGLTAGTDAGGAAILYYLAAYGVTTLGAFGVMMLLARRGDGAERIRDLAGLGRTSPLLAVAMTICMLSLAGIPPFAGFMGKIYLFSAALEAGNVVLVIVAVLNSVVSAAYYLGVVRAMYFDSGGLDAQPGRPYLLLATAAAVALTVGLGVAPAMLMDATAQALAATPR
jgi:NADH-quinone oxidoreductase subunit N